MMDCSNARAYYGAPPLHRYEASTDRKLGGLLLCVVGTRKRVYARLKNVHYTPTRVYAPLPAYTHPPRIRTPACVYAPTRVYAPTTAYKHICVYAASGA